MSNADTVVQFESVYKRYQIGQGHYFQRGFFLGELFGKMSQAARQRESENTVWALQDVSFELRQGETLGFVGFNGAGKSTLLKILSRITKPTKGRALTRGRVGSLLEIGTGFHPDLTGRENVFLNGSMLGMQRREIQHKLSEILEFADIDKMIDTPVKHYSTGQYMRLGFAIAAHLDHEILIVDEVLAVGDAVFQSKCLTKMRSLVRNQGRTVLFVSHELDQIESICTKLMWLDAGTTRAFGAVPDILCQYRACAEAACHSSAQYEQLTVAVK